MPNQQNKKGRIPGARTSLGLSEQEQFRYRKRAKQGDVFETEGAYGEPVFVPKTRSDINPMPARRRNRIRLEMIERFLDRQRKIRGRNPIG